LCGSSQHFVRSCPNNYNKSSHRFDVGANRPWLEERPYNEGNGFKEMGQRDGGDSDLYNRSSNRGQTMRGRYNNAVMRNARRGYNNYNRGGRGRSQNNDHEYEQHLNW
jgi:hypothetical protein